MAPQPQADLAEPRWGAGGDPKAVTQAAEHRAQTPSNSPGLQSAAFPTAEIQWEKMQLSLATSALLPAALHRKLNAEDVLWDF